MPTHWIFVRGKKSYYGYTAEGPPETGEIVVPDATTWRVKIEEVEPVRFGKGSTRCFGTLAEES